MYLRILIVAALCCLLPWPGQLAAQQFTVQSVPDPKQNPSRRHVSNPTGILSDVAVAQIDGMLSALEDSATAQVAVVVLPSIEGGSPKDFASELFNHWGIGYQNKNNGLLILFVLDQRRIEFETGYGLEGILPDVVCKRIQQEHMIPAFKKGDYNAGMIAGVEAVMYRLNSPEAREEVYDSQKYGHGLSDNGKLDTMALLVLAMVFSIILFLLRLIRWIVRQVNPIKSEIDTRAGKRKGHIWIGVLLYMAVPFALALFFGYFDAVFDPHIGEALLICYAYLAFLIWDSRSRREQAFDALYGKMPDPDQYVRLKTATRFYLIDAILFPFPMLLLWWNKNRRLHYLRFHPRNSKSGHPLHLLGGKERLEYLNDYQKVEESLGTMFYDVWANEAHGEIEVLRYEPFAGDRYKHCPHCASKAGSVNRVEIVIRATTFDEGKSKEHYLCKACGHTWYKDVVTPKITVRTTSSSGSSSSGSSWSSGGSSSSGSSWGGGRSGGGGAGSSW